MSDIGFDEAVLFLRSRIDFLVDAVGNFGVMIIVTPFGEVIGKF